MRLYYQVVHHLFIIMLKPSRSQHRFLIQLIIILTKFFVLCHFLELEIAPIKPVLTIPAISFLESKILQKFTQFYNLEKILFK